jgi:hypothetical protein
MLSTKKKERFEIILEPLQAILQLSLLSFCPIGTKLTIQSNLLYVQPPSWHQGIMRRYNNDTQADVFFLFNVIRRFNKFYAHLKTSKVTEELKLYKLLKELGKKGIDNLIQTYSQANNPALLHTLQMYKKMMDENEGEGPEKIDSNMPLNENQAHIDDVFVKIISIYDKHEIKLIYHSLYLMKNNSHEYLCHINGLNIILEPRYNAIKKWISDNIVF